MKLNIDLIKKQRTKMKINQQEMADAINIGKRTYEKIEKGAVPITLPQLDKMAQKLELNLVDLLKFNSGQIFNYYCESTNNNFATGDYKPNMTDESRKFYEKIISEQNIIISNLNKQLEILQSELKSK